MVLALACADMMAFKAIIARSRTTPVRQRPLCEYPTHAQYINQGYPQDAKSFVCRD
jgi:hypothetical protein